MKITVYSTPTCPYCKLVKEFLESRGAEFEVLDVSSDEEAARDMIEKSGQMGVPVIEMAGEVVIGFNRSRITELLDAG